MPVFREDPDLLRAHREGRREASERVYRHYVRTVERCLRAFARTSRDATLGEADAIADLLREVFVRAFSAGARQAYAGLRDFGPYLITIVSVATVGCHNGPCKDPGVTEGEQIQITVLAATQGPCTIAPLAPGDSFVLTGGAAVSDFEGCTVVGASPQVPAFAASVLTSCQQGDRAQLALDCIGMIDANCPVSANLRLAPHIDPGVASIDHGSLSIFWTSSTCNPGGCTDVYDVRIARLSAAP